jgi:predicted GNAT family N-acyltransferase
MIVDRPTGSVTVRLADIPQEFDKVYAIRIRVFQQEQGVPAELEWDGQDDTAVHFLALLDTFPVGNLRIRQIAPGVTKLERMAVLPEFRNCGIGRKMLETALEFLEHQHLGWVQLHAQWQAKDFYHKLGFEVEGETFTEAGILHIRMRKRLNSRLNP